MTLAEMEVVRADALEFLARERRLYDVVFVDPPYPYWEQSKQLDRLLLGLAKNLAPGARVFLESPAFPELPEGWKTLKRDRAGAVHYQLLEVSPR